MRAAFAFIALLFISGCDQAPRATAFFTANPDETAKVVARCEAGTQRGDECKNAADAAEMARVESQNKARGERFKRGING